MNTTNTNKMKMEIINNEIETYKNLITYAEEDISSRREDIVSYKELIEINECKLIELKHTMGTIADVPIVHNKSMRVRISKILSF